MLQIALLDVEGEVAADALMYINEPALRYLPYWRYITSIRAKDRM